MLDSVTKRNIEDCRDVLVGKVPDPKSQIEQITIALIYKFMDDMDKEAVEKFKGKAKFFAPPVKTGNPEFDEKQVDYSRYSWRKLFNQALSGAEVLALYSDALEKLNLNPNVPELFRNIFKNAYLPYRDPSTLKLFLKHINLFEYSHSEKLGDAFEYLLSVLGSQGDAGQFRTPRNIIDFITACVNPQKGETILDPACGTAGFLLSAYKHILNQNMDKRPGDKLSPDERRKLASSLFGYDISPDMVRLSLANMFLHGFTTPQIHEYDTLSSEDRWSETYDVILANPPFMTPKGGIRPHKKFGVQANRAEVLFTDYIAEHLSKTGRAGIVVPNGIVATTQTAYKQLRKMLVQDSLIAVVSLPAGCFNPYSGVKTSVLLLDKQLAKKSKHILFLKIENDGFDLGAQRREIVKNDLPTALKAFREFKQTLTTNEIFDKEEYSQIGLLVEKSKILVNSDIILSGERYNEEKVSQTEFETYRLGEILRLTSGRFLPKKDFVEGDFLVYGGNGVTGNHNDFFVEFETIVIGRVGEYCGAVHLTKPKSWVTDNCLLVTEYYKEVNQLFLKYVLAKANLNQYAKVGGQPSLSQGSIYDIKIPLPPLEIQIEIVKEIESYQKIIDGAKQVIDNYKPSITINPDWKIMELDELCIFIDYRGKTPRKTDIGVRLLTAKNIRKGYINLNPEEFIASDDYDNVMNRGLPKRNDVLFTTEAPLGNVALLNLDEKIGLAQRVILLRPKDESILLSKYLVHALLDPSTQKSIENYATGTTVLGIKQSNLRKLLIPIPPIDVQVDIVRKFEEEQALVNANKRLIEIFEQKIKDKISAVWGVKEEVDQAGLV